MRPTLFLLSLYQALASLPDFLAWVQQSSEACRFARLCRSLSAVLHGTCCLRAHRARAQTRALCVCVCYIPFVSRADLNVVDHEEGTVGTAELLGALTSHGWVIDFRQQVSGVRVGLAALGCDGVPLAVVCRTHMSFSRCCCRAWTTNWYALVCVCHVWPSPVDVSGAASVVPYSIPVQTEDRSLEHFGQRAVLHQASVSLRQATLTLKWACML